MMTRSASRALLAGPFTLHPVALRRLGVPVPEVTPPRPEWVPSFSPPEAADYPDYSPTSPAPSTAPVLEDLYTPKELASDDKWGANYLREALAPVCPPAPRKVK
jgi:hypothetical protein